MTIQQMKDYIHEDKPYYKLDGKDDKQIMAIYFKELKRRTKR